MTRFLRTESGSLYEFNGLYGRRTNEHAEKRGDGEWLRLLTPLPEFSLVGTGAILALESLAKYGPDDAGTTGGGPTLRRTSTVLEDWTEE